MPQLIEDEIIAARVNLNAHLPEPYRIATEPDRGGYTIRWNPDGRTIRYLTPLQTLHTLEMMEAFIQAK